MAGQLIYVQNFIGGQFVPCDDFIDSYNPSTGQVWAKVPNSGGDDVNKAVEVAKEAFKM